MLIDQRLNWPGILPPSVVISGLTFKRSITLPAKARPTLLTALFFLSPPHAACHQALVKINFVTSQCPANTEHFNTHQSVLLSVYKSCCSPCRKKNNVRCHASDFSTDRSHRFPRGQVFVGTTMEALFIGRYWTVH